MSRLVLRLLRIIAAVPHSWLVVLGNLLGNLLYWLAAPRRRIARTNLRLCFPNLARKNGTASQEPLSLFRTQLLRSLRPLVPAAGSDRELVQLRGMEHLEAVAGRR
jgi:KDO2-lipid IV(A) lauroyltransferase